MYVALVCMFFKLWRMQELASPVPIPPLPPLLPVGSSKQSPTRYPAMHSPAAALLENLLVIVRQLSPAAASTGTSRVKETVAFTIPACHPLPLLTLPNDFSVPSAPSTRIRAFEP